MTASAVLTSLVKIHIVYISTNISLNFGSVKNLNKANRSNEIVKGTIQVLHHQRGT